MSTPSPVDPKYIVIDKAVTGKSGQVVVGDTAVTFDQTDFNGTDRATYFAPMSFGAWTLYFTIKSQSGKFRQLSISGKYSIASGIIVFSYIDAEQKPTILAKEFIYITRFSFDSSINSDNIIVNRVKTDQGVLSHSN